MASIPVLVWWQNQISSDFSWHSALMWQALIREGPILHSQFQVASPVVRMMKIINSVGRARGKCKAHLTCSALQSLPWRVSAQQVWPQHCPLPGPPAAPPAGSSSFPGDNRDNLSQTLSSALLPLALGHSTCPSLTLNLTPCSSHLRESI